MPTKFPEDVRAYGCDLAMMIENDQAPYYAMRGYVLAGLTDWSDLDITESRAEGLRTLIERFFIFTDDQWNDYVAESLPILLEEIFRERAE